MFAPIGKPTASDQVYDALQSLELFGLSGRRQHVRQTVGDDVVGVGEAQLARLDAGAARAARHMIARTRLYASTAANSSFCIRSTD